MMDILRIKHQEKKPHRRLFAEESHIAGYLCCFFFLKERKRTDSADPVDEFTCSNLVCKTTATVQTK